MIVAVVRVLRGVDAHSGRCGTYPGGLEGLPARSGEHSLVELVGELGVGDGRLAAQGLGLIRADLLETLVDSVSIRDTKNDATDAIRVTSCPFALACSMPARNASMTCSYRSRPKMSVTFTLMPSASVSAIAGMPASVAGILMKRLGRSTSHHSAFAFGHGAGGLVREPGIDLNGHPPSTPDEVSYAGRITSHAHRTSYVVIIRADSSTPIFRNARSASCSA
jgi:hypothetical protein